MSAVARTVAETYRELARERRGIAERDAGIVRLQMDVAAIGAPTGAEQARAAWMSERLREIGLRPRVDDAGNVIARAPGAYAAAPVVVCAHLDTVFPPETEIAIARQGERITGPGICDNGRGLAAMIAVADSVQRYAPELARPVEFVATTGEEGAGDLRGAKHYFANAPEPFAVIALDGAGDERIVNTALGSRRFKVTYQGPGGHSWAAYGNPNPIHAAARAATLLANVRPPSAGRTALTVSRIGGGLSVNSIAESAWLEVDVRSTSAAMLERFETEVRAISESCCSVENERRASTSAALTHRVERIGNRAGGETPIDSALVVAALEATRIVGRSPELATASTDANAAIGIGVPAIAIGGGGRGGETHSSREWFDNTDATAGLERALTLVASVARLAAD